MTTRMHLIAGVGLLGALGTLVGCGGDGSTGDTSPSTNAPAATTAAAPAPPLETLLLDVGDVGPAWRLGPAVTDADIADATQLPCPDMAVNPTIAARLTPVTGVQFEPADGASGHLIEFVLAGEPDRLTADLRVWFDAMDACAASTPTSTATGSLTVEPLALPELGDQRAAHALVGVLSPEATWFVRRATVRVGAIAATVSLTEILQTPEDRPATDDDAFVGLVEAAAASLDAS